MMSLSQHTCMEFLNLTGEWWRSQRGVMHLYTCLYILMALANWTASGLLWQISSGSQNFPTYEGIWKRNGKRSPTSFYIWIYVHIYAHNGKVGLLLSFGIPSIHALLRESVVRMTFDFLAITHWLTWLPQSSDVDMSSFTPYWSKSKIIISLSIGTYFT